MDGIDGGAGAGAGGEGEDDDGTGGDMFEPKPDLMAPKVEKV